MSELAIKIRVADREYPLRVSVEEEARLRVAGRALADKLREFRDNYGITDKQDLLAMIALSILADQQKVSQEQNGTDAALADRLERLGSLLEGATAMR